MIPEATQYLDSFRALHKQLSLHVTGLPVAGLDWVPTTGANSLAVVVAHAIGAERLLITQTIGGTDVHRDRDAEFRARGLNEGVLVALIQQANAETEAVLPTLSEADMALERQVRGNAVTTRWCIVHALEHLAEHVGHAGLTRQLWDARSAA